MCNLKDIAYFILNLKLSCINHVISILII